MKLLEILTLMKITLGSARMSMSLLYVYHHVFHKEFGLSYLTIGRNYSIDKQS